MSPKAAEAAILRLHTGIKQSSGYVRNLAYHGRDITSGYAELFGNSEARDHFHDSRNT